MILREDVYVPALRWRQGEYQALLRLKERVKSKIVPLISIPDVEFDFESRQLKSTIHAHVLPFVRRYKAKWGKRPAWITLHNSIAVGRMDDGSHVFDYVFDGLRCHNANAIPTLPLGADTDTVLAAARATTRDRQGAGITIRLEDLMRPTAGPKILALAKGLAVPPQEVDLIVDLRAPNFQPYNTFAIALIMAIRRLGNIDAFRNFVLIGTAVPETFRNIAMGSDEIPRHDWLFFQALLRGLPAEMRRPIYGDYTTVHPDFTAIDMRKIKPAGKVIYTASRTWATRKGGAFRDNPGQMHRHCAEIVNGAHFEFRGQDFSCGDKYIADCAVGHATHSNLTRWKEVGINHHITLVAEDLASFAGATSIV